MKNAKKGVTYLEIIITLSIFLIISESVTNLLKLSTNNSTKTINNLLSMEDAKSAFDLISGYLIREDEFYIKYKDDGEFDTLYIYVLGIEKPKEAKTIRYRSNRLEVGGRDKNGKVYTNTLIEDVIAYTLIFDEHTNIITMSITVDKNNSVFTLNKKIDMSYKTIYDTLD